MQPEPSTELATEESMPKQRRGGPGWRWILRQAWRDSRGSRRSLVLFMLCTVAGLAALTAIRGFRDSLSAAVDQEARSLLGADLEVRMNRTFPDAVEKWIAAQGGEVAREVRFRSMAWLPKTQASRLVQVRAQAGGYPFAGKLETDPPGLSVGFATEPVALVERSLMTQYGLEPGDEMRLGTVTFRILGAIIRVPGDSEVETVFAPRVLIPEAVADETGLLVRGSVTRHRRYVAWPDGLPVAVEAALAEAKGGLFAEERVRFSTVEDERRKVGRTLDRLTGFLQLTGLTALLLGGVGVAGGVQIYLRDKLTSVAVLRCLGCPGGSAFAVCFVQVAVAGGLGSLIGTAMGAGVQPLLPTVAGSFIPLAGDLQFDGSGLLPSFLFGWLVILLCALGPMFRLRRATPLSVLRGLDDDDLRPAWKEPGNWLVGTALVALTATFALRSGPDPWLGLGLVGGLLASAVLLALLGALLRWLLRRLVPARAPYAWRLGLSSLHRPQNRTLITVVTLGLGLFLVLTLFLVRDALLGEVALERRDGEPDTILFDIQADQVEGIEAMVKAAGLPVLERVAVVTMRLREVRGKTLTQLRTEGGDPAEPWALNWEYRASWRAELNETETLLSGTVPARYEGDLDGVVPVTIEESIAKALAVDVGDRVVFDVQGLPMQAEIAGIRKVDWSRMRPNFYVLFPEGVLEEAPQFLAVVTRTGGAAGAAKLQQDLVQAYPNVSLIDLSLVLETFRRILDRVALVLRFLGAFVVVTGLLVLASTLLTSRPQRLRESVLLRTLGASRQVIRTLFAVEYALVGLLAGLAGAALAAVASAALAHFVFKMPPTVSWLPIAISTGALVGLTVFTGWLTTRGVVSEPPLAVLRRETG